MAKKKETQTTKKAVKKKTAAKMEPATKTAAKKTAQKPDKIDFPIVGIGASAGGLEALEAFFTHMPSDKDIAFVIIQHLSPKHKSIMGSLLAKCTKMQVFEMEDGMKIAPNCVYLNPPDKNVVIIDGTLQLMDPIRTAGINLPIDSFFRSMAEELGEKAICVILSGTATDGTLGLKEVKGEGGIAMVQDPASAKYDGMPRSAVGTGIIDFILPVEEIPAQLIRYVRTPYVGVPKKIQPPDDTFENHIQKIFALIRSATGNDFSHYKQTTIRRRIERRMAVHQIHKIKDYVRYLQDTPAETILLFKDMLIGVTGFFRDPEAYKVLEEKVIPALLKDRMEDSLLRVWVVGCSTGEEAYSLAILFSEAMNRLKQPMNIQIFASDIDEDAIENARNGTYPDSIAADVSQERLKQFFVKEENVFQIKKQLREMVVFAAQNVIKDPPFSKIDLISCRNLLIYMDGELQKKVLPLIHYSLNPHGTLFLGPSETIGELTDLFKPVDAKWKVFKRQASFSETALDYPGLPLYQRPRLEAARGKEAPPIPDVHTMAERTVLDHYALPGVLVNHEFEIVHFMGRTDPYLETPTGRASFNILKMAREGLRFKLGTALRNATQQKKEISYEGLRVTYNGGVRVVDLMIRPLTDTGLKETFLLVMFRDRTPAQKPAAKKGRKEKKPADDPAIVRLEQELVSTREHLQTTIEELETSNEELKSTNEELQSVNEEIQSTNEELETSKEELQSTNEELVTVNTELQNKVDELSNANNDINNLLAATDIGTIFLDTQLRIKRYTPAMTRIFNLIPTDVDRPISDITGKIKFRDVTSDAQEVLRTLVQKEEEIQSEDGSWYSMKISPYRTLENVIEGVVITFVDITRIKLGESSIRRLATVVMDSNDAITVQDFKGNITAWNRGAEKMYGYTEAEALKMNIRDIVPDDRRTEALNLIKTLRKEEVTSFETQRKTKKGQILDVWLTITRLVDDAGKPVAVATTERDVTGRKAVGGGQ